MQYWDYVGQRYQATASAGGPNPRLPGDLFAVQADAFSRFCSATLSARRQFESRRSDRGYGGRIYFANEENGNEARASACSKTDDPAAAAPRTVRVGEHAAGVQPLDTTMTIGSEDGAFGQLRIYEGVKRSRATRSTAPASRTASPRSRPVDESVRTDRRVPRQYGKGTPVEFDLAEVDWDQSGLRQNAEAAADGLTLNRIEDGAWDPRHPTSSTS